MDYLQDDPLHLGMILVASILVVVTTTYLAKRSPLRNKLFSNDENQKTS